MKAKLLGLFFLFGRVVVLCAATEEWHPRGGEYVATFGGHPAISEAAFEEYGEVKKSNVAQVVVGATAERAESTSYEVSPFPRGGRDSIYKLGLQWAQSFGMRNIRLQFEAVDKDDMTLKVSGNKDMQIDLQTTQLSILSVWHYGRSSMFVQMVVEPSSGFPSGEALRFLQTLRHLPLPPMIPFTDQELVSDPRKRRIVEEWKKLDDEGLLRTPDTKIIQLRLRAPIRWKSPTKNDPELTLPIGTQLTVMGTLGVNYVVDYDDEPLYVDFSDADLLPAR